MQRRLKTNYRIKFKGRDITVKINPFYQPFLRAEMSDMDLTTDEIIEALSKVTTNIKDIVNNYVQDLQTINKKLDSFLELSKAAIAVGDIGFVRKHKYADVGVTGLEVILKNIDELEGVPEGERAANYMRVLGLLYKVASQAEVLYEAYNTIFEKVYYKAFSYNVEKFEKTPNEDKSIILTKIIGAKLETPIAINFYALPKDFAVIPEQATAFYVQTVNRISLMYFQAMKDKYIDILLEEYSRSIDEAVDTLAESITISAADEIILN